MPTDDKHAVREVAIVGGGISGLATAFYLTQRSPEIKVSLFEAAPRLGGTMHTVDKNGFLFEAGPNGFLTNKPDALRLAEDCGAGGLLLPSSDAARIRYVYHRDLHRLPESPGAFLRTPLLSARQKMRVLAEVFVAARRDNGDESLLDFGYRRLGHAFTDVFIDAMAAGVHASTPAKLSVGAAFPAVVALEREYGGLFRGMIKKRRAGAGPGGVLTSFRGGMGAFVAHLQHRLDAVTFHLGAEVSSVQTTNYGCQLRVGETEVAVDHAVLATPAHVTSGLLRPLDAPLADALDAIDYTPVAVVGFGYETLAHPLHGFGLLTTSAPRKPILGILWDSAVFEDRAPPGAKSMRVLIGGQRDPGLALADEDMLVETARRGIWETMGIDPKPSVTFVQRWSRGIPHYAVGHGQRVKRIFDLLSRHSHLHLCSNAFTGVGVNDCVASARQCAETLARVTRQDRP